MEYIYIFFFGKRRIAWRDIRHMYHLSGRVTACSFNSQLSVEKRRYVLKYFLLFSSFSSFRGHTSDFRPSHRILSHSRPPSNLLPDSLLLFQMSESALPHRHVFISGRRVYPPDPRESTPRFSRPVVTEMHRVAQTPIIESFVTRWFFPRQGFSREKIRQASSGNIERTVIRK